MKNLITLVTVFLVINGYCFGQKAESFDIITFQTPAGWQKEVKQDTVQFGTENASGGICLVTLFRSMPAVSGDSKKNFEASWETIVKEVVTVKDKPQMNASATENGWTVESGAAQYESADGKKGLAMLVTASGENKMINILFLMNTDAFQTDIAAFLSSLNFKKTNEGTIPQNQNETNTIKPAGAQENPAKNDGYAFTTTNFDDGWTSTVQEDWVEVTKGDLKVLIHYPTEKIKPANTDISVMCEAAWNTLVAPRYSNIQNYRVGRLMLDFERPYYAEATLTDNKTGKKVFVVLFKKATEWMEFVTPDRDTFIRNFGVDISTIDQYADSSIWNKMVAMKNHNKFGVAAADLKGEWSNKFSNSTYYANVYTGMSAGMSTYSSSITFEFGAGQTYKWRLVAANSFAGKIEAAQAKGAGVFKVLNNWQVLFPDIEGKPVKYDVYFSVIKGGRILWMNEDWNRTSGFTGYGRIK
jgi:hypothetical protein